MFCKIYRITCRSYFWRKKKCDIAVSVLHLTMVISETNLLQHCEIIFERKETIITVKLNYLTSFSLKLSFYCIIIFLGK